METFSALLAICAGNSPVTGEFPTQRPVMRSFDVFFDLSLNNRWNKQSWGWWFETSSRPLWRHCNEAQWPRIWQIFKPPQSQKTEYFVNRASGCQVLLCPQCAAPIQCWSLASPWRTQWSDDQDSVEMQTTTIPINLSKWWSIQWLPSYSIR